MRRVFEVVPQETCEPTSMEEATEIKRQLQREIEVIQQQLADRDKIDPQTGRRMEFGPYNAWRKKAITAMHAKQQQLRKLKAWMTSGNAAKKSEWTLLARAHKLLEALGENNTEVEQLLDDIEYLVPRQVLEGGGADAVSKTGSDGR